MPVSASCADGRCGFLWAYLTASSASDREISALVGRMAQNGSESLRWHPMAWSATMVGRQCRNGQSWIKLDKVGQNRIRADKVLAFAYTYKNR